MNTLLILGCIAIGLGIVAMALVIVALVKHIKNDL